MNAVKVMIKETVDELKKTKVFFLDKNQFGLLTFRFSPDSKVHHRYFKLTSLHFGVRAERNCVYIYPFGREIEVDWPWVFGWATETYDRSLKYFGLGPLMLVCWLN